jgi:hypothetical protein
VAALASSPLGFEAALEQLYTQWINRCLSFALIIVWFSTTIKRSRGVGGSRAAGGFWGGGRGSRLSSSNADGLAGWACTPVDTLPKFRHILMYHCWWIPLQHFVQQKARSTNESLINFILYCQKNGCGWYATVLMLHRQLHACDAQNLRWRYVKRIDYFEAGAAATEAGRAATEPSVGLTNLTKMFEGL